MGNHTGNQRSTRVGAVPRSPSRGKAVWIPHVEVSSQPPREYTPR